MKAGATNRRNFLKWLASAGLLASGGVSATIVRSILDSSKTAEAAGEDFLKHFLLLNLSGAPPRWMFDLWLKPNATDAFEPNPMTYNALRIDAQTGTVTLENRWVDVTVGDRLLQLPPLWQQNMLFPDGDVPMSELLDHWVVARTGGSGLDGHNFNNLLLVTQGAENPTLTGLIADASELPIPAVSMDASQSAGTQAFRSRTGVNPATIYPDDDAAKTLLTPFRADTQTITNRFGRHPARGAPSPQVWNAVGAALTAFQADPANDTPARRALFEAQRRSEQLISGDAYRLSEQFAGVAAKYQDLILSNLRALDIPGVNDQPIPGISFPFKATGQFNSPSACPQLASRMVDGLVIGVADDPGFDLRTDLLRSLEMPLFANELALAELAFKNDLTAGIVLSPRSHIQTVFPRSVAEMDIDVSFDAAQNQTTFSLKPGISPTDRSAGVSMDAHVVGSLINLLVFTSFFRAIAACLYEFKRSIGQGRFQDTLIEVACEFARSPRLDQQGSDHGFHGGIFSFFSGRIRKGQCIGDILKSPPLSEPTRNFYVGTWGWGAPSAEAGGQTLGPGNILSSVAALFGVPSPAPNAIAILTLGKTGADRGKIVSRLPEGTTVDESETGS
jgi:hypothetical protein